jgi:hypothetical protein
MPQLTIAKPFSPSEADFQFACAAGGITNTTDVVLRAAPPAGQRNHLTSMQIKNVNAVATEIVVKDGATVIWRGHCPASMLYADMIHFPNPVDAAGALNFACLTTGAQVFVSAQGYVGAP